HLAVLLGHHAASRVAVFLHFLFRYHDAAAAGHNLRVLLRHHATGRVAALPHHGFANFSAHLVLDDLGDFPGNVLAATDRTDFLTRAPALLPHPAAGLLHLAAHDFACPGRPPARA